MNPESHYGDFTARGLSLRGYRLYTGKIDGRLVFLDESNDAHCEGFAEIDFTQGHLQGLRQWHLPTNARATPITFVEGGHEYLAIAAGGNDAPMSKLDTKIVAFRIEK